MDKKRKKELESKYDTVVFFKKIMGFLCNKCELNCTVSKKTICTNFSFRIAKEIATVIERRNKEGHENIF